jgi:hypothetical protein
MLNKNTEEYETKTYQNVFKGSDDAAHTRHGLRRSADGDTGIISVSKELRSQGVAIIIGYV